MRNRLLVVIGFLLNMLTCGAATIYQKWDSNIWTTSIGSGANPATVITPLPGSKHYLYADLYRNNVNNGCATIYVSLGADAIPAGTTAGNVTPFWLEMDYRYKGGSGSSASFGLFNSAGDNDNNPALNMVGAIISSSNIQGFTRNSAGDTASTSLAGAGTDVLHRFKMRVYNSGGKTLMDLDLYSINEETFKITTLASVDGYVVLDIGQSLPQGMDVFGIRNRVYPAGDPASHSQYDLDNCYFSTSSANKDHPVPSFAALCVSSVLQSGSSYFDPWNRTRWANWYADDNLIHQFAIDCDVTLATGHDSEDDAWTPDVSALPDTQGLFYIGDCSRGKTFNGNGQFIDVRLTTPSLSTLYLLHDIYSDSDLFPAAYGFLCDAANKSGVAGIALSNFWLKGCVQGIRTTSRQTHPMVIDDVELRHNKVNVYLSGAATTVNSCGIKASGRSGMYVGSSSHDNDIINNNFQDGNYEEHGYYSDIIVDSSYGNYFEGNTHQEPTGGDYHVAVKLIRNMGESGNLRENSAWGNTFIDNSIDGYCVGYEVGARMGENIDYDLSDESRDYAQYNVFQSNTIANTAIGIKLNTSGNEINGNTFSGVGRPILLHDVFYSLTETKIYNQDGTKVSYWFINSDWNTNDDFADWFKYQNDVNDGCSSANKYIQIMYTGTPSFDTYTGTATLLKKTGTNPSQIIHIAAMNDVKKSAGTPIDVAAGDFWEDSPGDEIAVIWNEKTSTISGTDYYTIIIYDSNGIEVNRCGRSATKWLAITAGDFLDMDGEEIAAVPDAAVSGKYPIYVFARGRKTASVTLQATNTTKIAAIAAGNFNTGTDSYDEIAFVKTGALTTINYCKPTLTNWSATTTVSLNVMDMAGGEFDGVSTNGDEIAAINDVGSRAHMYRVGGTAYYERTGPGTGSTIKSIAAGNFDGDASDEVAFALSTATSGEYPICCYNPGSTNAFKTISQNVQGVYAKAIAAGTIPVGATLGIYERAQGFSSGDYGDTIEDWGESIIMIPSAAQTTAIPAFILNADPADSAREYLKVTPIVR